MHRRFYKHVAVLSAALLTCGCVQMTRHSNTVVFGTNTSVGLRVGSSAASVPELQVGYARQEAVVMPVVANTGDTTSVDGRTNLLVPCNLTTPVKVEGAAFAVHPCSLVAVNGKALDSYSVLASFGANFDGSANTSEVGAKGGLAQYFATGMAAQLLALNGGAAVVAVGKAAEKAAETAPTDQAVKSLFGDQVAFGIGVDNAKTYPEFRTALRAKVQAAENDDAVKAKIEAFEDEAGINTSMRAECATKAGCLAAIDDNSYGAIYNSNSKDEMIAALGKW